MTKNTNEDTIQNELVMESNASVMKRFLKKNKWNLLVASAALITGVILGRVSTTEFEEIEIEEDIEDED